MRIETDIKLDYSDVLIRPKRSTLSSRREVQLQKVYKFKHSSVEYSGIPVMAANMDKIGTFEVAKLLASQGLFTCVHKHYTVSQWIDFATYNKDILDHVAVSTGTSSDDFDKLRSILLTITGLKFICIDVANGYSEKFVSFVSSVRSAFPNHVIIAGNVVTADMTQELLLSGADIIKVGIGSGSVCSTRVKTGCGYPQLSAVIECADAAHGLGGHIIADGGCTCAGDIAKSFGAGADFVMLGGMFAGTDETGSEFYGMSSDTAMNKYNGGVASYRASEGKTVHVESRGPIQNVVQEILGGVRSACTYVGAATLKDLPKCTTFIQVHNQYNSVFGQTR